MFPSSAYSPSSVAACIFRWLGLSRRSCSTPSPSTRSPFLRHLPPIAYSFAPRVSGSLLSRCTRYLTGPSTRHIRRHGENGVTTVTMAVRILAGLITAVRSPCVVVPPQINGTDALHTHVTTNIFGRPISFLYRQPLPVAARLPFVASPGKAMPSPPL